MLEGKWMEIRKRIACEHWWMAIAPVPKVGFGHL
jgi:hypothetical protein